MAETLTAFFTYTAVGLSASFRDLSYGNPSSWEWDFGDGSTSIERHPTHLFTEEGFQTVTLKISDGGNPALTNEVSQKIGVSATAEECPQMPTYDAVIARIPPNFLELVTPPLLYSLIRKWQRIISKLVTPNIPENDVHNELHWPLLANELVIELTVLDIFEGKIKNFLMSLVSTTGSTSSGSSSGKGGLKAVITGPSEVHWYDNAETLSEQIKNVTKSGGFIDQSKNQACTLAAILGVPLQICPDNNKPVMAPRISKKS